MEGNNTNWKPNEQGGDSLANNAANDWRSQLDPELRKRVLTRIIDKLKEYFPKNSQHDINLTAVKFEERTFAISKDKSDYVRKLSEKMIMMEKRFKTNGSNTPDQAKVVNQTQSVPTSAPYTETSTSQQWLQQNKQSNVNIPGSSDMSTQVPMTVSVTENVNIQIGEGIHINLLPGTQIQIQGRQEHVPQQQQLQQQPQNANFMYKQQMNQQLLKEKIHHTNLRPLQIQQQAQPQQHQTSSLSTIQQSFSPQSPALSGLPSSGKQTSNQQNSQLLPRYQFQTQRVSSSHQQQMAVSSQEEKKQKQEQLISQLMSGPDTQQQGAFRVSSSSQQNNTASFQAMTQQKQNLPSLLGTQGQEVGQSQPVMLQQYKPQHPMKQQKPQNRSLHQHMDFVQNDTQRFQADQQNQSYQLHRASLANPSTSQDSTSKTVNVSGGNWQEETYQKIKVLKDMYLPLLSTMLQRITQKLREIGSLPPQVMESNPTEKLQAEKLKAGKSTIEHVLVYLNAQRNSITEKHRDRYSQYEEHVLKLTKNHTMPQRRMQQRQGQLPSAHQSHQTTFNSQTTQVSVSQSFDKGQINSRLPSVSGFTISQTTSPHSFQTRPKMEPKDEKNIMASSGNAVLPSLTSNISSAQSNMFQQHQQKPFHQIHQTLLHRKQQQQQLQPHQTNELNDVKMRQGVNIKAELLQKHLSSSQRQLLKPLASSNQLQNHSSPRLVDQQILPATVNKTGTSSKSSGSSFVSPSPIPGNSEKPITLDESPTSHAVAITPTLNSSVKPDTQEQSPFTVPPEPITERPIDRLIKALQSSSPESLAESVNEISSVISLVDSMAGSFNPVGGSIACLGEDLSARTNFRFQRRNLMTQGETNPSKRLKRSISTLPSEIGSYQHFSSLESEVDSTASSCVKVNKIELGSALVQEIKEINGKLIETLVEICDEDNSGTIVTCSYAPVALSSTFKDHYKSGLISQIQPLRILVPANYPYSSPILLDDISSDASVHKYEDLSARTRSRFSLSMRELSESVSLKKLAQMWNDCARATMIEYAERHGGGTFSSKYGAWETVLRAS